MFESLSPAISEQIVNSFVSSILYFLYFPPITLDPQVKPETINFIKKKKKKNLILKIII